MSDRGNVDPGEGDIPGAGSSTDQHITGAAETGTFTTDQAPTGDTPSHGSSDTGITSVPARGDDASSEPG